MSAEHSKENTEPDNVNVGLIATVTIVGALLVVAIAAALTALVRSESAAYGNEIGTYANLGAVKRLKAEQHAKLEAAPGWTERGKGLVSVPIDRAMGLVAGDIQRNPYLATQAPPKPLAAPDGGPPALSADGGAPGQTGQQAPSPGAGEHDDKPPTGKDVPKDGKNAERNHADGKTGVKIDPPKGAPVAPAGAPAHHE